MNHELKPCPFCGSKPRIRDYNEDPAGHIYRCVNDDCIASAIAAEAAAWNRRAPGWIPFKDKEPEDGLTVLAFTENGEMAIVETESLFWDVYNVTHWMPLPDEPEAN